MNIPEKGWFIVKTDDISINAEDTEVFLDGKKIGGILKATFEIDAKLNIPVLKLEIFPHNGITLDIRYPAIK